MQHCSNEREKPRSVWIVTHLLFSCRSFIIHHLRTCGATLHLCKSLFLASRPSSPSSFSPLLPSSSTLSRKIIPHFLPRPQHRNIIISRTPTSTTFFLPPPAPAPAPPPPPRLLSTSQTPSIHRRRKTRGFFSSSSSSSETSNRPCGSFTLSKTLAGVDFLL